MNLKSKHLRLVALEDAVHSKRCPVCATWGPSVHLFRPAGESPAEEPRPDRCPNCGREEPVRLIREYDIRPVEESRFHLSEGRS